MVSDLDTLHGDGAVHIGLYGGWPAKELDEPASFGWRCNLCSYLVSIHLGVVGASERKEKEAAVSHHNSCGE